MSGREAKQREKVGGKRDGKILRDREKMGRKSCTKGKGDTTHCRLEQQGREVGRHGGGEAGREMVGSKHCERQAVR